MHRSFQLNNHKKAWPLHLVLVAVIIYYVLQWIFFGNGAGVNKWYGMALQILGGFGILQSINKSLLEFTKKSFWGHAIEHLKSYVRKGIVIEAGVGEFLFTGMEADATVTRVRKVDTLEDAVNYLERQITEIRDETRHRFTTVNSKIEEAKTQVQSLHNEANKKIDELQSRIVDITVGDAKEQVTGFFIIVIGIWISTVA